MFQEAVVISSYLNFNKIWKKCHFPIKAHAKSAFLGYLNVIVCTAKTRSMTYWFFCLIWVRRWYTLQRSDLYTSVVIHKWDQHTSLSSILGWIRPIILELLALEWRKFHTFELEYLWSQLTYLDQILCVASLGWGKGCIRFWGRLDQNSGFHGNRKLLLTYNGENDVSTFSWLFLIRSF